MPDYPTGAAPIPRGNVSINFLDAAAKLASVPFEVTDAAIADADFNDALIAGLRTALGNLSNAAVRGVDRNVSEEVPTAFLAPFDEAHSSVANRLNLLFMNIEGQKALVSIPAPDLSFFTAGGGAMIRPDAAAAAGTPAKVLSDSILAIVAFLNVARQPADPSWRLANAYETTRAAGTRGRPSAGRVIYAEEPEVGELPAGAPDTAAAAGQQP